ncbi:versicolorin B synthase [Aspergillus nomiae NRRL 13137]|uniref:Versicolorin B synthase n=1 Tax=Aspergillus nomiae NRRL (strain ATCC 15546 / NRRL 13137 / CBS 260.88 / M93) TaxID=1509407 RepID=A0A0L1J997_ASPN3|nr:versicolorin B synthase [Aspergillus nomiae NRRL 13137]KNG88319.1 versicolorin B synthase [Aspergillus nomiae NRRL 13137]
MEYPAMFNLNSPYVFRRILLVLIWLIGLPASIADEQLTGSKEGIPGIDASFDYVVVGGGNAGVTLAARLAEQSFSVALVEAGDFYEIKYPPAKVPGAVGIGVGTDPMAIRTTIDWGFLVNTGPGANSRTVHYEKARCIGGATASNFMLYHRPTIGSMKLWAELVDDESYIFDNVFPLFKKTINFTAPNEELRSANATVSYREDAYDREGQPVDLTYPHAASPFSSWLQLGLESVGVRVTSEFNSGSLLGSFYCPFTIRPDDQSRSSSESAFFRSPSSSRYLRPLTLYKNTMGKKILFDQKRATGVEVATAGSKYILRATHEVIISSGAFQSPQLLMVSGIGPANVLQEHEIDVIVDLPGVGQNLWDQPFSGPTYPVAVETFNKLATDLQYLISQIREFKTSHTGALTNHGFDYVGFEKLPDNSRTGFTEHTENDLSWFPEDWPEIEYIAVPLFAGNFSDPITMQPQDGRQYATILSTLMAPTSRGNVTIISADTEDLPVINGNWLTTETDQQVLVAAYKRARDMFRSEAMAPVVVGEEYFPGKEYQSDREILEVIRDTVMAPWHASCTCKMGTRSDRMAVLDSRARVFGVERLRVVDASAFPFLPPGHPQSVVYMLAEKIASDIIGSRDDGVYNEMGLNL